MPSAAVSSLLALHSPSPLRTVIRVEQGDACAVFGMKEELRNVWTQSMPPKLPAHDFGKLPLLHMGPEGPRTLEMQGAQQVWNGALSAVSAVELEDIASGGSRREGVPRESQAVRLTQKEGDVVKAAGPPWVGGQWSETGKPEWPRWGGGGGGTPQLELPPSHPTHGTKPVGLHGPQDGH